MIPDELPKKFRPNSTISKKEFNALRQGVTGYKSVSEGVVDSQTSGNNDRNLQYDNYFNAHSFDELPPYSVFAIRKPEDVPGNHYGPLGVEVGIFTHTSKYPLLTNGESDGRFNVYGGVTAGAVRAKVIGWDTPTYVRVNPSPAVALKIGYPCGPVPGQTYVDGDRTGLICVAFDTTNSLAQVIAAQPGQTWLVKPNSSIGPFSTGTVTVWGGQVGSEVVSNPLLQLPNVRNVTSGSFASGTFAFVVAIEGQLYLFPMGGNVPVVLTIIGNSMGDTVGEEIGPAVDCLFRAKITGISAANGTAFCNESKYSVGTEVWAVVIDRPGGSTTTPLPKLTVGDRFIAVLAQDTYTVDPGGPQEEAHAVYAIRKGVTESMAVVTIQPISGETVGTVIGPANDKCLFKGKITAIADDGYCDETPYSVNTDVWVLVLDRPGGSSSTSPRLTVGDRFLAKLVVDSFTVGVDPDEDTRPIYAIGKRGDDTVRIVTILDQDAESGSCLWSAALTVPPDMEEQLNFCEDPFDIGEDVWVLILNSDLGSFAPSNKIRPVIGEQYIGKYIGNYALDNVPIYCIRVEMNDIYHVTATNNCASGASAVFSLPVHGGTNVTATNWSPTDIVVGDKVTVYKDHAADTWYAIKPGSTSGGGGVIMAKGLLTANVSPVDATVTMNSMTRYDGVAMAASITAQNVFGLLGKTGMLGAVVYHDPSGLWDLLKISNIPSYPIEAYVYAAFNKNNATFQAIVTKDYMGYLTAGTQITVQNYEDHLVNPKPYLFEGETGADCLINYDPLTNKFRVDWVECPKKPVEVSPGDMFAAVADQGGSDTSNFQYYF